MGRSERRDRARIYAEILEELSRARSAGEAPKVTRVQSDVNVPFVRFKGYLEDLAHRGLVRLEPSMEITEKGLGYVREYRRVREFLEQFGLAENDRSDVPVAAWRQSRLARLRTRPREPDPTESDGEKG